MKARLIDRLARADRIGWVHAIVLRVLPRAIARRYRPPRDGLRATLELAIRHPHRSEPARFVLAVDGERCSVHAGAADRPAASATLAGGDLIRLAGGTASWPELFSSGRFELTGDPFLALRFASLFALPVELEPVSASRSSAPCRPAQGD